MAENIAKDTGRIVIDDGSVRVPIENTYGDTIGVFYFRPTDIGMITRYNEIVDKLDSILDPLKDVDIKPDGTADENNDASIAILNKAEQDLFEACDYMFGGNMSEAFFGKMHPFSPVGGTFYCVSAIEMVGKYIESQFNMQTREINKRMERYTKKYSGKRRSDNA